MIKSPAFAALFGISFLVAVSALVGILIPEFYAGCSCGATREAFLGQDAVSLIVLAFFLPSIIAARRASVRGLVMSLGCLSYYIYCYGYYAFGLADTPLFLAYLAILGASVYSFIFIAAGSAPPKILAAASARMPRVAISAFLIFAAAFTGLAIELPPLLGSAFAWSPAGMKSASAFVVLDLAILFPGMAVAAFLVLRRRGEGYFFSGVLLVKTATLMPAIVAADLINLSGRGKLLDPSFDIVATVFFAASVFLCVLYFKNVPRAREEARA